MKLSAESTESREKKRRRRSRWGSDSLRPSAASIPPSLPVPSPSQSAAGFSPAGMSAYPPPVPPIGLRPPGMVMSPQLGAAGMPRPNMPGTGSEFLSLLSSNEFHLTKLQNRLLLTSKVMCCI